MSERGLTEAFLHDAICGMIDVERTSQGFEVSLPQVYHTGHNVAVVVSPQGGGFLIHGNSAAAMLLSSLGLVVGKRMSDGLRPQIAAYGCKVTDLRIWRTVETLDQVGLAMTLVGCASRLMADQALKADPAPLHDFKSALLGKVVSLVGVSRVRTNEEVSGHLGSRYRVSAVVLDDKESRPVAFVEPIADREAIARRFKQFYDLSRTSDYTSVARIAVYDDYHPLPAGDALLLNEVGNLIRFSDTAQRLRPWTTIQ